MPKKKTDPDTHFDPRSPHGERLIAWKISQGERDFDPRSPHGERPQRYYATRNIYRFRSTLSSRRATDATPEIIQFVMISIHALLTESDQVRVICRQLCSYFDPRSPHGERPSNKSSVSAGLPFRSTLSSRRATPTGFLRPTYFTFRSTLSSRRATFTASAAWLNRTISIHALLTESDMRQKPITA